MQKVKEKKNETGGAKKMKNCRVKSSGDQNEDCVAGNRCDESKKMITYPIRLARATK